METVELVDLEKQVNHLITNMERLQAENNALRHKLNISLQEKTRLQECNHRAAIKVKHLIRQLREELA